MSVRVQSAIWKNSKHGGSLLLLLLALADFADDDGKAFPSIKTLAEKTRMSERGIQYMLAKLKDSGELEIQQNAGPKGCNLFRVKVLHQGRKATAPVQSVQGCKPTHEGVQSDVERGATAIAPESSRTIKNHQKDISGPRPPDEAFETFVEVFNDLRAPAKYPRDTKADFVQLAKLRKDQGVAARASPPEWLRACRNYCASPLGKFTLADLCTRYAVFVHSGVNQYGKPIGQTGNGHSKQENPNTRAAQDFVSRKLAETLLPNVPDVREESR